MRGPKTRNGKTDGIATNRARLDICLRDDRKTHNAAVYYYILFFSFPNSFAGRQTPDIVDRCARRCCLSTIIIVVHPRMSYGRFAYYVI